jgi:hypothetical protein
LLISTIAPAAQARVDAGDTPFAAGAPAIPDALSATPRLADQISSIIEMRTMMMDRAAPQPGTDCADPQAIARRLAAIAEMDAFTRTTINGLIDAAPSSDLKTATSEELAPVLVNHRRQMSAALRSLMELPLVREKGALAAKIGRLADQAARP